MGTSWFEKARTLCCVVWLLALPGMALAQGQPMPRPGRNITIGDLQGTTIHATIAWAARVRWLKNNVVYDGKDKWDWTIQIGPGASLQGNIVREVQVGGYVKTLQYPDASTIGHATVRPERGGSGLWTLQNNVLTRLTVFHAGGNIARFTLARSTNRLSCRLNVSYAREAGAGGAYVTTKNPFGDGSYVQLVSFKQTSSTCRVTRP